VEELCIRSVLTFGGGEREISFERGEAVGGGTSSVGRVMSARGLRSAMTDLRVSHRVLDDARDSTRWVEQRSRGGRVWDVRAMT
jgi:hypothetical protein